MVNSSLPIVANEAPDGDFTGRWWTKQADGRILCQLCPRACRLKAGDRGFCFVRMNQNGKMVLDTYGRSTGFCIDPIEKKPLNHFLAGTPVSARDTGPQFRHRRMQFGLQILPKLGYLQKPRGLPNKQLGKAARYRVDGIEPRMSQCRIHL